MMRLEYRSITTPGTASPWWVYRIRNVGGPALVHHLFFVRIAMAWEGIVAVLIRFIAPASQLPGTETQLFGKQRVGNAFFVCTS